MLTFVQAIVKWEIDPIEFPKMQLREWITTVDFESSAEDFKGHAGLFLSEKSKNYPQVTVFDKRVHLGMSWLAQGELSRESGSFQ